MSACPEARMEEGKIETRPLPKQPTQQFLGDDMRREEQRRMITIEQNRAQRQVRIALQEREIEERQALENEEASRPCQTETEIYWNQTIREVLARRQESIEVGRIRTQIKTRPSSPEVACGVAWIVGICMAMFFLVAAIRIIMIRSYDDFFDTSGMFSQGIDWEGFTPNGVNQTSYFLLEDEVI